MRLAAKAKKLTRILGSPFYRAALRHGVAAGVEHEALLSTLSCNFVVDIGANRGQFSLVCRKCYPHAEIHAFEPLPTAASVFTQLFAKDSLARLHQVAVGERPDKVTMHVSRREDSSSLLPIGEMQERLFPGTSESHVLSVDVVPLDSVISRDRIVAPALLKIDVQGFEVAALAGCSRLLQTFDYLYVECSFVELYRGQGLAHEVIAMLEERDFFLAGIHNVSYGKNGRAVQADFFFRRATT